MHGPCYTPHANAWSAGHDGAGMCLCHAAQRSVATGGAQAGASSSNRVVLKVSLQLEKLEARLQYEASTAAPLGLVSVEAVAVDLTVRPDTLNATASLGNLKAQDGALPEVCAKQSININFRINERTNE